MIDCCAWPGGLRPPAWIESRTNLKCHPVPEALVIGPSLDPWPRSAPSAASLVLRSSAVSAMNRPRCQNNSSRHRAREAEAHGDVESCEPRRVDRGWDEALRYE